MYLPHKNGAYRNPALSLLLSSSSVSTITYVRLLGLDLGFFCTARILPMAIVFPSVLSVNRPRCGISSNGSMHIERSTCRPCGSDVEGNGVSQGTPVSLRNVWPGIERSRLESGGRRALSQGIIYTHQVCRPTTVEYNRCLQDWPTQPHINWRHDGALLYAVRLIYRPVLLADLTLLAMPMPMPE